MPYAKAIERIGPHLLGRTPPTPDVRDWSLESYLPAGDDLDIALLALVTSRHTPEVVRKFAQASTRHIRKVEGGGPQPPPPPPPPSGKVLWNDPDAILDQGQTGHCVGFGCVAWGDTDPVEDHWNNDDGHALYYEAKAIDGDPTGENGSSVHSGMKALANRGRVTDYAWTTSLDTIRQWVSDKGPVVVGADWYQDMFSPDQGGFVAPGGGVAGGHCFLVQGYDPAADVFEFQNSWGSGWGDGGRFRMHASDFDVLVQSGSFEGCAAVELPR